jgi:4-hydroxybenzoyl-CoA reductase subunit beta
LRLPRFEYIKPASLEEALTVLQESGRDARILAGGTDLLVNMKYGIIRPKQVVSIRSINELCSISEDSKGNIRIGACVTLSDLAENNLVSEKLPTLKSAVKSVASKHIRNMASVGGNICLGARCWYYNQSKLWRDAREACHRMGGSVCHAIRGSKRCHAINSSDTAPALMVLGAEIDVQKKGHKRLVPVREFFADNGARHTVLEPEEMATEIVVPAVNNNSHATFIKVSSRRGIDFAMGSIAALVTGNSRKCSSVKLVIGSVSSAPLVLEKAVHIIMESGLTDESIEKAAEAAHSELGTVTNLFTSAGYKRDLARVLVRRALQELKGKIKKTRRAKN